MNYPAPGFVLKPDRLRCLPGRRTNDSLSEPRPCARHPGRRTSETLWGKNRCAVETPPTQCGRPGAASASHSLGQRGFDGWGHVSVNSGGCAGPATRELRRRRDGLQHQGPWTASRPPAKGLRVQLPAASRSVPCARTCAGHFGSGGSWNSKFSPLPNLEHRDCDLGRLSLESG